MTPIRLRRLAVSASAIIATLVVTTVVPASVLAKGGGEPSSVIYSSLVSSPLHGNLPSLGGEAYSFSELGNAVTFASSSPNRSLGNVTVTMSSWGCASGHWYSGDCVTPQGAGFSVPITFTVYEDDGITEIASAKKTFDLPYRPSASAKCDAGRWYDNALKACFNGLATNIMFEFAGQTLPERVRFGIAYNTTHHGDEPIGESAPCYTSSGGCGYDSLNIALSTEPGDISAGSDTNPGFYLVDGQVVPNDGYVPAVQIKAAR